MSSIIFPSPLYHKNDFLSICKASWNHCFVEFTIRPEGLEIKAFLCHYGYHLSAKGLRNTKTDDSIFSGETLGFQALGGKNIQMSRFHVVFYGAFCGVFQESELASFHLFNGSESLS